MKIKVLPMNLDCTITSYQTRANVDAITSEEDIIKWKMSNFIQTKSSYVPEEHWFHCDFYFEPAINFSSNKAFQSQNPFYPFIETETVSRDTVKAFGGIINFAIQMINMDKYIYLYLNMEWLDMHYNVTHPMSHDVFIYGYDEKNFYATDFFAGKHFGFAEISFANFEKAYESMIKVGDFSNLNHTANKDVLFITTVKVLKNFVYSYTTDKLKHQIVQYLNKGSTSSQMFQQLNCFKDHQEIAYTKFGNQHFDNMKAYLSDYYTEPWNINDINTFIRPCHNVYNHKQSVLQRLLYMQNKLGININNLILGYQDITIKMGNIRDLLLYMHYRKKISSLPSIIKSIDEIKENESEILECVLEKLIP